MVHTVIPPLRVTTGTLELTASLLLLKGHGETKVNSFPQYNDNTIPERDREVGDFNVTLLASVITRRRHFVIDTHRTDLGSHATRMPPHP